jgi:hypothetical protein
MVRIALQGFKVAFVADAGFGFAGRGLLTRRAVENALRAESSPR